MNKSNVTKPQPPLQTESLQPPEGVQFDSLVVGPPLVFGSAKEAREFVDKVAGFGAKGNTALNHQP